ncbi:LacI family DNA-binding transcriptional regulator [Actinoplanes sp. NPDC026619]|uniref:LacI family DNA-binding transcriptional regulator n=1 Tax=Actinoplanes sp. NPDC026619 TaxID=3155798 RepID=UPI0033D34640
MTTAPGPKQPDRVTMREIAARLGVSAMTVSRAIRGDAGLSPATRERVMQAVDEVGYRPNDLARRLRTGEAHELVGLIVTNLANPFYAQLAVGIEEIAAARGAGLVVASTDGDLARERDLVRDMAGRRFAGLVVVPAGNDHGHLSPEGTDGAPVVLAATPPRGIDTDCVLVDDFGGTYEACRILISRGHERIGFLGLPASLWTGSERYRGYAAALEDAGLVLDERYVSRHRGDIQLAAAATRKLLALPDPPTALITANNRNTIGALRAVRRSPVPVALAGFDDIELADLLQLPLSVVSYDAAEVGRQAARLLFGRIDEPDDRRAGSQRVVIPTRVVDHPQDEDPEP